MANKQQKGTSGKSLRTPTEFSSQSSVIPQHIAVDIEKGGDVSYKTPAITKLPDGTICIGSECATIRIPPAGSGKDIEIDARGCDENTQRALGNAISQGSGADFKLGKKKLKDNA